MTAHFARLRLPIIAAVIAAAAAVGIIGFTMVRPTTSSFPGIGGPFTLTDQNGKPVTEKALEGRPTLLFFGYTHCPDICPTALFQMSELMRAMGPTPGANAAFITVDPERDTPAVLRDYLSSSIPTFWGLTGDRPAIDAVLKSYRVYAKKVPGGTDGDYTMDHSALVYLMDKNGRFVSAFNLDRPPAESAAQLRKMM